MNAGAGDGGPPREDGTAPVLILQHLHADGPAYLATWLQARRVPFRVFNTEAGDAFPERIDGWRALAVLGGEMSANDDLPSLRQAERLIVQAVEAGRPVIGHCLGGQLMSRALGGRVGPSPAPEVGWLPMTVHDDPLARAWFGDESQHEVFQWHGEAFTVPDGAVPLAGSAACPHQAFALGPHLAMQFHVEIDDEKLGRWSRSTDPGYLADQRRHACVHDGDTMRRRAAQALPRQQRLADRLYARWLGAAG